MQTNESDLEKIDNEHKYKLQCLARHLLRKPLTKRRNMLKNMQRIHGVDAIETIKLFMISEFNKIQENKKLAKNQLKDFVNNQK